MTTADQLIAQGEARGQVQLMVRMLTSKFGDLDADVRYGVEHATTEQIAVWSHRLVQGAGSVEEIVGPKECLLVVTDLP